MKCLYNTVILLVISLLFTACKKYPDGGFVDQTRKHLFGGHNVGNCKTRKLKLYEVNGIESTYLIQGASSIPDFYEKFVTLTYTGKDPSKTYTSSTFFMDKLAKNKWMLETKYK